MYSVVDLLNDEGIRNDATFEAWCAARRRKGESRYQTLKRIFGQINADRIMRVIEVASWKLVDVRKARTSVRRAVRSVTRPARVPSQKHIAAIQRRKDMGYE